MSKEFGENLRRLRGERGLTQKQVAEAVHIDRSTYAYYECGTTEPSLITVQKLADVFNVPVTNLLPKEGNKLSVAIADVPEGTGREVMEMGIKEKKLYSLGREEEEFIKWFRGLSDEQREAFKGFAQKMEEENN